MVVELPARAGGDDGRDGVRVGRRTGDLECVAAVEKGFGGIAWRRVPVFRRNGRHVQTVGLDDRSGHVCVRSGACVKDVSDHVVQPRHKVGHADGGDEVAHQVVALVHLARVDAVHGRLLHACRRSGGAQRKRVGGRLGWRILQGSGVEGAIVDGEIPLPGIGVVEIEEVAHRVRGLAGGSPVARVVFEGGGPLLVAVLVKGIDDLHQNTEAEFTLDDPICQKKFGAVIFKPVQAYKMYRKIVKYFATRTLMDFCRDLNQEMLTKEMVERIRKLPLYTEWENVGGQIIPSEKIRELFEAIKNGSVNNWNAVHQFYNLCNCAYEQYKVRYALYLLEQLYSRPIEDFSVDLYRNITDDVSIVAYDIYNASLKSREKDYTDYYRNMVYRSEKEMEEVIGPLEDNSFLLQLRKDTAEFTTKIREIFVGLTK